MPQRYAGHRLPWLLAQVFEFGIGASAVLAGVGLTAYSERIPAAIEALPEALATLFRLLLLLGGLLVVFGVYRAAVARWSNTAERVGLYFVGSALAAYAVALFASGVETALFAMLVMSILSVCCAVKAYALGIDSKNRLAVLRRTPTTRGN